jgi:uncharacterized protein YbaR (Trm112 family)
MVLIFGWGAGEAQDLGEVVPVTCPNCHNDVFLHHIRSEKRVSLYFVPVAPYGSDEYLACPICRQGLQLQAGQRPTIDRMRAATASFRRGNVPEPFYRDTVRGFWASLGIGPSAGQLIQPPASIPPPRSTSASAYTRAPAHAAPSPGSRPGPTSSGGPAHPGASSPAEPGSAPLAEQLEGLAKLHADGVLTDEEFGAAKRRLLGG